MSIIIKYTKTSGRANIPVRHYPLDAGFDLESIYTVIVPPLDPKFGFNITEVPTGIAIEMPDIMYARITGRSSAMRNSKLMVVEGIVDGDYRGELVFGVVNLSPNEVIVERGTRLAQLIFHLNHSPNIEWKEVLELTSSARGVKGFGSTGGL